MTINQARGELKRLARCIASNHGHRFGKWFQEDEWEYSDSHWVDCKNAGCLASAGVHMGEDQRWYLGIGEDVIRKCPAGKRKKEEDNGKSTRHTSDS